MDRAEVTLFCIVLIQAMFTGLGVLYPVHEGDLGAALLRCLFTLWMITWGLRVYVSSQAEDK